MVGCRQQLSQAASLALISQSVVANNNQQRHALMSDTSTTDTTAAAYGLNGASPIDNNNERLYQVMTNNYQVYQVHSSPSGSSHDQKSSGDMSDHQRSSSNWSWCSIVRRLLRTLCSLFALINYVLPLMLLIAIWLYLIHSTSASKSAIMLQQATSNQQQLEYYDAQATIKSMASALFLPIISSIMVSAQLQQLGNDKSVDLYLM